MRRRLYKSAFVKWDGHTCNNMNVGAGHRCQVIRTVVILVLVGNLALFFHGVQALDQETTLSTTTDDKTVTAEPLASSSPSSFPVFTTTGKGAQNGDSPSTPSSLSSPPSPGSSSGNIYPGQSVQSVLRDFRGFPQYYPTVNKCCPFFSRYEGGTCVQAQNASNMVKMSNEPYWEAPKAMVTLLGKDPNGMEISNDTVVFR